MKSTGSILRTILLLICLGAAAVEGVYISKLIREKQEIRASDDAEKKQIETKASKELAKHNTELRVLRVQNQDLLKLRGEVRRLRPLTNEVAALQAQVLALSVGNSNAVNVPKIAAVETTLDIYVPKEDWAFAGFSNPEAAIESVIWAGSQGDLDTFLASLTPDGRAKFEEQALKQNKSPEDMVGDLKQNFTQFTGFRILEQSVLPDDTVMMRVFMDGANLSERFFFKKIGDEWRMSDSKNDR
jgi:hypothetical protein